MDNQYYVYIMTSNSGVLYTGVTNSLERRVWEHKAKVVKGFTSRYKISQLVYYETTGSIESAIEKEKQIKGWVRAKKINLINSMNPEWKDLSLEFMDTPECHSEACSCENGNLQHPKNLDPKRN
ncbi:MAG: GIY-YIG nuclease family protein [Dehalococcoidales bacterium]|nr:GIY-YIG nuclease family protein [Dehalococcoidales bacterium]